MSKSVLKSIKVLSVFGTRPEAVKMCPLVKAIQGDPRLTGAVCVTGQHRQMLDQVLKAFDVQPDYDLNLMRAGQTLSGITAGVLEGLGPVLQAEQPDIVLVHGDTTTSFAAALAAFYQQISVGHVEAGLRSGNKLSPFPEEMNRCLTGRIANLHFAPTQSNADNLRREGIAHGIFVTGNTVIDALFSLVRPNYTFQAEGLNKIDLKGKRTLLLTAHRRENLGEPLRNIFAAVLKLAELYDDVQVIYPVHLNPAVREPAQAQLGGHPRIHLIDPLDVQDMHNLMAHCHLMLTDSGGLQEEAPALGKPVLVLRTETERPEAVEMGTVRMAGVEAANILREARALLDDQFAYDTMANAVNPYGDGHASERICDAIAETCLIESEVKRPC
ncbi:MAG: UDP-N-acetylglucosamine 2-epimerase (non-hydrolyzing) [Clostridia bacterium]|nr:UDP-N-acetylglucosamine 2-epimerase (non-hydrolyzing) [Clostridia bacterium]